MKDYLVLLARFGEQFVKEDLIPEIEDKTVGFGYARTSWIRCDSV